MRKLRIAAVSLALAVTGVVAGVSNAEAATQRNGVCELHEVCLYWSTNYQGPLADYSGDVENYTGHNFPGYNIPLNDNTLSVRNRGNWMDVRLCTNSYFRGDCIAIAPGNGVTELDSYLANKLSSHEWWT